MRMRTSVIRVRGRCRTSQWLEPDAAAVSTCSASSAKIQYISPACSGSFCLISTSPATAAMHFAFGPSSNWHALLTSCRESSRDADDVSLTPSAHLEIQGSLGLTFNALEVRRPFPSNLSCYER